MLSKIYTTALICLLFVLSTNSAWAQFTANAGRDTAICAGSVITLGGSPVTSGGQGTVTYMWTPGTGLSSNNSPNPVATPSSTTTYVLVATDAASNVATDTVVVTVNPVPTSTFTVSTPSCVGQSVTVTYTGNGLSNAAYSWNFVDGTNIVDLGGVQGPYKTTFNSAGTRNLTLSILQNGCRSLTTTVPVTVHTVPTATFTITSPPCVGQYSYATYTGNGTATATYHWSFPGAGIPFESGEGPYQVSWNDTGSLPVSLQVTDSGCSSVDTVPVHVNMAPIPSFTISSAVLCAHQTATITYIGNATAGAVYSWNFVDGENIVDLGGTSGPFTTDWATPGVRNLTLQITQNGCQSATASYQISVDTVLHDSVYVIGVSCHGTNDGSVCVYVVGGPNNDTYTWSNGSNSSQCINNLAAGTYVVTINDGNGCSVTATGTVPPAAPLRDSVAVTNVSCGGNTDGTACCYVLNGRAPFSYTWSNNQTTQCVFDLAQGVYVLTVVDAANCTATATGTVAQNPGLVVDSVVVTNACLGNNTGSLCAYVSGGTPGYVYVWSNGGETSQCITGLAGNTYNVTVTDAHACTAGASGSIGHLNYNLALDSIVTVNGGCAGGSACAYVSGGVPAYFYQWSSGATGQCITGLTSGQYAVIVTDVNGCSASGSGNVSTSGLLLDSITLTNVTCNGGSNGSICVYPLTGVAPYNYIWSNGASTQCISNLAAGFYTFTVFDANNCSASGIHTVNTINNLLDSVAVTNVACNGGSTGSACVYILNGTSPYTYNWSNGVFNQACITNAGVGTYTFSITDANNCSVSASIIIAQSPALTFDSISRSGGWCGNGGATLCASISGGTLPYSYLWREGSFNNTASGQCISTNAEQNWVIFSDAHGCTDSAFTVILLPAQVVTQVMTPDSNSVPDSVSLIISGGSPPYTANWADGDFNIWQDSAAEHVYVMGGVYADTITDAHGCVTTFTIDAGCSDQCVWPGDANYDGIVDNNDLLAIGVGYDSIGYARINPTISFTPQYCQNWNDTLIGAVNYKHVDCNGDGIINANDTAAIVLNYALTHARGGSANQWKDNAPVLYIKTSPDTLNDGETLTATLSLGSSALPVSNVYGLAFTYNFDPNVVDTNSVNLSFGNSWLFGTGDHISVSKTFYVPGQLQAGVTRIDHINRSGYGTIGTITMKITTGNINGKNLQYYLMNNFISNLKVIDNNGQVLTVNEGADSAIIAYTPTGIIPVPNKDNRIRIFPNPATDQLIIVSTQSDIQDISIVDLTGQQVIHQNMQAGNSSIINISGLSDGVYMVKLITATGEYRSRFIKAAK